MIINNIENEIEFSNNIHKISNKVISLQQYRFH